MVLAAVVSVWDDSTGVGEETLVLLVYGKRSKQGAR
jgi:hypothetical protein